MGASGSVTMRARLWVREGGADQESSGELLSSPSQEAKRLGMVSPKLEVLTSRVGSASTGLLPRLQALWAVMRARRSARFRAVRGVIWAVPRCATEGI